MEQREFDKKVINLKILKSVQEYMKNEGDQNTALYPIRVPNDFLVQILKMQGPDNVDKLIHHIFRLGLEIWSDDFFSHAFGSQEDLQQFIDQVKQGNKGGKEA